MIPASEVTEAAHRVPIKLWYSPDFGNFYRSGRRVGYLNKSSGYRQIKYNGKTWQEHRLAFLIMEGRSPHITDHINRVRSDNRWINLREVSSRQNAENRSDNAAFIGVGIHNPTLLWHARSSRDNGRKSLGYYKTNIAACNARWSYDQV